MLAAATEQLQVGGGVSRRDFLRLGGLSVLGLSAAEQRARAEASGKGLRRCIFILMTGGPSHFETFDPKPAAPGEFRGPFKPIATTTPGLHLCETLPLLAQRSSRFAVVRSVFHDASPIHETGQQLIQTGRLVRKDLVPPSLGSIVSRLLGSRNDLPAYAVLPRPLGDTGVAVWQGQRAGDLGIEFDPWDAVSADCGMRNAELGIPAGGLPVSELAQAGLGRVANCDPVRMATAANWMAEPDAYRRSYGDSEFGRSCLAARRLVEHGVRFVAVNMFDTLATRLTWDCHANESWAPATLADYRNVLCPDFDRALTTLLDDLDQRGLLNETLVVAAGEFGRTPRLNDKGGRDHWPGVWSVLLAGGGVAGGQVLGGSDARGMFPAERPVSPAELAATILHVHGIDLSTRLKLPQGAEIALADAEPIKELVG